MLCDNCRERDAAVHLTQIQENQVVQLHLCEKCAAAKGVETTVGSLPKHPLGEFLSQVQAQAGTAAGRGDAARCHFCSSTMKDFRATGRLGCAHCYQAFETSLRDLLRRVHNSGRHVGRRYDPPAPPMSEKLSLLGELRQRLRRAIENEEFELAADLRDRIRVLE